MVNLFDIMRNAQRGEGLHNLSRQFGLPLAETQRAVEALLPAFSLGFQRNIHDPNGFAQLIRMLSSGQYAPFFDGPAGGGATPPAWMGGTDVMTRILGSKEVSRKVAEQAAATTGVGVEIVQQMLPMVAATIMGGVFRYASLEGLGDLFAHWSEAFRHAHVAQQPAPAPAPTPFGNPFEMWTALMSPMAPAPPPPPNPGPQSPAEAWSAMVDAVLGSPPSPPRVPAEPPKPPNPLVTLSQMFDVGNVQAGYLASLQQIMDGFWGSGRPH